jgi:hypothetical protein
MDERYIQDCETKKGQNAGVVSKNSKDGMRGMIREEMLP